MQAIHPSVAPPSAVLFQCEYGRFRSGYMAFFGIVALLGAIAVPVGFFWNTGWELGGRPLEPWSATLIIEIFALAALAVGGASLLANLRRAKCPQRVAVTRTSLIVPKGMFSSAELDLPFSEIKTTVFNVGFVKQLQILHGRKKLLLTSAAFN